MVGRGGGRYREREKHTQEINKKPGSFLREPREEHFERKEEIFSTTEKPRGKWVW
jgi:hypothetical protein